MQIDPLAQQVCEQILSGFETYINRFRHITKTARQRFEERDWHGIQSDSQERQTLYKDSVKSMVKAIENTLGERISDKSLWKAVKTLYQQAITEREGYEVIETFYNSVYRKVFKDVGSDPEMMFSFDENSTPKIRSKRQLFKTYTSQSYPLKNILKNMLLDCQFKSSFEDIDRDIQLIIDRLKEEVFPTNQFTESSRMECLTSIFFRNKAAYLVGRVATPKDGKDVYMPFILPLLHGDNGIYADTVIFDVNTVSIVFSFTRSYFLVEVEYPSELVAFLHTVIPTKSISELYNSIGFSKHGKTEFYRDLVNFLNENPSEKFILAPGIKGMVMRVFTLPNYPIVFKLIKDKFDPPKKATRQHVKNQYQLVKLHDRVGRMADTHEFENFAIDRNRFSEELWDELQKVAPSLLSEKGDKIIVKHVYTERKMIPLNLYLDKATDAEAEEAVGEYGNAIKQLAAANIFPGDMLLKNFGVTRHRRVVFYDYDEICFLTDCNFRRIPEPRDYYQEYASEAWYSVNENDIFPEEFRKFLIGHNHIRKMFDDLHGDIFDVKFWKEMQNRINAGEVVDVFPYRRRRRFRNL